MIEDDLMQALINKAMIIIGITGTLGAGKGTVVNYLVEKKGFVQMPSLPSRTQ